MAPRYRLRTTHLVKHLEELGARLVDGAHHRAASPSQRLQQQHALIAGGAVQTAGNTPTTVSKHEQLVERYTLLLWPSLLGVRYWHLETAISKLFSDQCTQELYAGSGAAKTCLRFVGYWLEIRPTTVDGSDTNTAFYEDYCGTMLPGVTSYILLAERHAGEHHGWKQRRKVRRSIRTDSDQSDIIDARTHLVGSSKNITGGLLTSSWAIESRLRWPPERLLLRVCFASSSPRVWRISITWRTETMCRWAACGRREAGGGRREAGGGRREVGGGRRMVEGGRREAGGGRREAEDGMRETGCGRRKAGGRRREAGGGRWKAGGGRREAEDGMRDAGGGRREAGGGRRDGGTAGWWEREIGARPRDTWDGRREAGVPRWDTDDGTRTTGHGRRDTNDRTRTTGDELRIPIITSQWPLPSPAPPCLCAVSSRSASGLCSTSCSRRRWGSAAGGPPAWCSTTSCGTGAGRAPGRSPWSRRPPTSAWQNNTVRQQAALLEQY